LILEEENKKSAEIVVEVKPDEVYGSENAAFIDA
jgi:hypothetical protein